MTMGQCLLWTSVLCLVFEMALSQSPSFSSGVIQGYIDDVELDEASGCAASRNFPGILYTHNDSGDRPRVFAVNTTDATVVAILEISPATHHDWEDIAVGPCSLLDSRTCIYILDDGLHNDESAKTIYKVLEPDTMEGQTLEPEGVLRFNWTEQGGSKVIMVDNMATVYLISNVLGARGMIVSLSAEFWGSEDTIWVDSGSFFSMGSTHHDPESGDISADGQQILVKNNDEAYYWTRPGDGNIEAGLTHPGVQVPIETEELGEAICWAYDGSAYFTLSEGLRQPLYKYSRILT